MDNTLSRILLSLLLVVAVGGCQDELEELGLRSEANEAYYWENNRSAAQRVRRIMYGETDSGRYERFKIVHISDPHLSSWSGSNHYKLPINLKQSIRFANQQELRIDAIAATGDFISIEPKETAKDCMRSFVYHLYEENHVPTFLCTGNHDSNANEDIGDDFLLKHEINEILFGKSNYPSRRPDAENYYYADVPAPDGGTIRFIALDMLDQPDRRYNTLNYAIYSQAQIDWLTNVALKEGMTERHSVVVLNHYPFQPLSSAKHGTYLSDGRFVHPWNMIPEIIEAFRTRSVWEKTYPNQLGFEEIRVKADFRASEGEFVCYLGGHNHSFAYFDIEGLDNESAELPAQKMILCTNQAPSEVGVIYNKVEREEDSLSSNSFCIHAIDTREKKIYITFFGAYKPSNDSDYPDIHTLSYR